MSRKETLLLIGPENGQKAAFIKTLKDELKQKHGPDLDEYRFYPFETDLQDVIGILRNGSLFSQYKIVTLYQAETISKKGDIAMITEYVNKPADNTTLILLSDEIKIDAKLKNSFPKEQVKIFWEMFENKKQDWIRNFFSRNGREITQDAVDLILELVENNTLDLQRECRRLILYFSEKQCLEAQDVETFLYHSKEENIFTLFEKIVVKDFDAALEVTEKLLLSGESNPVQMLGGLLWQFRNLHRIYLFIDKNYSFEEACLKVNIRSKKVQKNYRTGIRKYSREGVERIFSLIAAFDLLLRSGKTEIQSLLVSLFLYYCIQKDGVFDRSITDYSSR